MWKKALFVIGFIGILIAGSIGGQIGREVGKATVRPSSQEIEAKLVEGFTKAANQYNKQLPMMVDQDIRLDKATVGPGPRVVYHHTFPEYTSGDIDVDWLQTDLRPEVTRTVCANADMKKSLQHGGIYSYAYSGSDGAEIARFEIDRNDCGFQKITP